VRPRSTTARAAWAASRVRQSGPPVGSAGREPWPEPKLLRPDFPAAQPVSACPSRRLVYAGGPSPDEGDPTEARIARDLLDAIHIAERLEPRETQTWLLVTTAMHMPRAMGVFRRAGFQLLAYPVDYRTGKASTVSLLPTLTSNLERLDYAAYEWLGLLSYRVLGRTDALFPQP
jgi:hypothetical protein